MSVGLRPNPFTLIIRPPGPPTLPGQAIAFAYHEDCKRRPAFFERHLVNFIERLTHRPHFGPRKTKTKVQQKLRIANRAAFAAALLQYPFDPRNVMQRRNPPLDRSKRLQGQDPNQLLKIAVPQIVYDSIKLVHHFVDDLLGGLYCINASGNLPRKRNRRLHVAAEIQVEHAAHFAHDIV